MIDLNVNTVKLETAIVRFSKIGGGNIRKIVKQQAGILVGHMIALTPPGKGKGQDLSDSGGIALSAKKQGEAKVEADIRKIFPTSKLKDEVLWRMIEAGHEWQVGSGKKMKLREIATSEADLKRIHGHARNPSTGRTRSLRGLNGAVTRKSLLNSYIKGQKKKVGRLNAGWLAAAGELKTSARATPAWITRHANAPGGITFSNGQGKIGIRIFNNQTWFPGDMESRVFRALNRREKGLEKAIASMLERQAAKANADMNG